MNKTFHILWDWKKGKKKVIKKIKFLINKSSLYIECGFAASELPAENFG